MADGVAMTECTHCGAEVVVALERGRFVALEQDGGGDVILIGDIAFQYDPEEHLGLTTFHIRHQCRRMKP